MAGERILHETDTGQTFDVAVGEPLVIELPELGTTGYRWKQEEPDESVLTFEGSHVRPHPAPGGAGTITFEFRAKAPGTARLRLKLWREWMGDASILRRFEALLHVH